MSIAARLQREIKTNPAKAAGLGVLVLVATWFWAPLIGGMFSKDQGVPPPVNPSVTADGSAVPVAAETQPQPSAAGAMQYDWQKYAKLLDDDQTKRPAAELTSDRDPFAGSMIAVPPQPEQSVKPQVVAAPVSPAEVGLTLTSTLLGSRKRIAEIGGKSYTVGDRVIVQSGEVDATFRVVEIQPRRVVLEGNSRLYELTISRPLLDSVLEERTSQDNSASPDNRAANNSGGTTNEPGAGDRSSKALPVDSPAN